VVVIDIDDAPDLHVVVVGDTVGLVTVLNMVVVLFIGGAVVFWDAVAQVVVVGAFVEPDESVGGLLVVVIVEAIVVGNDLVAHVVVTGAFVVGAIVVTYTLVVVIELVDV
jgi:hypothetical protein